MYNILILSTETRKQSFVVEESELLNWIMHYEGKLIRIFISGLSALYGKRRNLRRKEIMERRKEKIVCLITAQYTKEEI